MTLVVHGIPNCDTVKRARAWLAEHGAVHTFHDFKKDGLSRGLLDAWIAQVGWERLVNRQGLTWKKLDEGTRAAVTGADAARALMLDKPSIVKRPVVAWPGGAVTVGFDADDWARRL
jgi:Spx/MgsR family transcriptional regulator